MDEITLNLEKKSDSPLYMQLYRYLQKEIMTKRIIAGAKLPSIRQLARHLKISNITVNNAYHQLLTEGYIESREKSGFYVLEIEKTLSTPKRSKLIVSKPSTGNIKYDFSYGNIDTFHFNFNVWRKLTSQLLQPAYKHLLQLGNSEGEVGLREEISKYLRASRGVLCSPEQIIITSGTESSLQIICDLANSHEKSVAFEEPGWQKARHVFQKNNFRLTPISMEKGSVSISELKKSSSKFAYISPSHQFPTGGVMPIAKRMEILEWCESNDTFILEDDYDSEFRYDSSPIPSLQGLDRKGNVIYLGGFSKSFTPSLRISYVILPAKLLDRYHSLLFNPTEAVPRLTQKTLELFMRDGYWEKHIRKMRRVYHKKYTALIAAIKEHLLPHVNIIGMNAGLHILLEVKVSISEEELIDNLKEEGVLVYPTSKYWFAKDRGVFPTILIGFAGLSKEEIVRGIILIKKVIHKILIKPELSN